MTPGLKTESISDGFGGDPEGYDRVTGNEWACLKCAMVLPRNAKLLARHNKWHLDLDDRLDD